MKHIILILITIIAFVCKPLDVFGYDWHAKWIMAENCVNSVNTWQVFRKDFNIAEKPSFSVIAHIAVDSKYWLWVNGKMVVFEGGLKRGPSPSSTYYDEVDIAPYLVKGNNCIAILSCYFGKSGFSHNSSGMAGMIFDAEVNEKVQILSDDTWQASVYGAYSQVKYQQPNYRLPESSVCFDASKSLGSWYAPEYSGSLGKSVVIKDDIAEAVFGTLVRRPVPLWKDYGLKSYQYITRMGNKYVCKLPYNAQITPYLKLKNAAAGQTITIKTDHYTIDHENSVCAQYITADGAQEYESYCWMNGHNVEYTIPNGVEVDCLMYRETGYDTDMTGTFSCNDDFLNELYKRSARTLYVNMRDGISDCPDRERAQWWGDIVNDIQAIPYVFTASADSLVLKAINELLQWKYDNVLHAPTPGSYMKEFPIQELMAIGWYGFYKYYMLTADSTFVKNALPIMDSYLSLWNVSDKGMVEVRSGDGDWSYSWGDWGSNVDLKLLTNLWYYLALKSESELAVIAGNTELQNKADDLMQLLETNFDSNFWGEKYYVDMVGDLKSADDRANALAVLSGLCSDENRQETLNVFTSSSFSSPMMELYVQRTLFESGMSSFALDRLKSKFSTMMSNKNLTTLCENWDTTSGSKNHAWSSWSPAILNEYICGIQPLKPGFEEYSIKPNLCGMTNASTSFVTKYGTISVNTQVIDKTISIDADVPAGCKAYVEYGDNSETLKEGSHHIEYSKIDQTRSATSIDAAVAEDGLVTVYNTSGVVVRSKVEPDKALIGLPTGIYIINGKKHIVSE